LAYEAIAGSAYRQADRDLPLPRGRPAQQQPGHIAARDEKHEPHGDLKNTKEQDETVLGGPEAAGRRCRYPKLAFRLWRFVAARLSQSGEFRLGLTQADALLHARSEYTTEIGTV